MRFNDARAPRKRISLTPLIDIVFLLLVFFMLSSSFVHWQRVDLEASSESAEPISSTLDEEWVTVKVKSCGEGGIKIDGKSGSVADIGGMMSRFDVGKISVQVVITDDANLACMVEVLDKLNAAKVSSVTVAGLVK